MISALLSLRLLCYLINVQCLFVISNHVCAFVYVMLGPLRIFSIHIPRDVSYVGAAEAPDALASSLVNVLCIESSTYLLAICMHVTACVLHLCIYLYNTPIYTQVTMGNWLLNTYMYRKVRNRRPYSVEHDPLAMLRPSTCIRLKKFTHVPLFAWKSSAQRNPLPFLGQSLMSTRGH